MTSSTETVAAVEVRTEEDAWREIRDHVADMVDRGLVLPTGWVDDHEPAVVTPIPHGPGVVYDRGRAEHVVKTIGAFEHTKGKWAGRPLRLLDWQATFEICPVFGLLRESTGLRIIRTAWFEKPRKNGKSTECSGLGLVLAFADREAGAEVYAAARNRDQARIVFAPAKAMAERSPSLRKKLGRGIQQSRLEHPSTGSIFRPLASDLGGSLHGLNVHGGIVDEVHIHKTPDTIDAIETGTGSREQPLVVFITTADEGVVGSVYDTKRTYVENLAAGIVSDPSFYAVVFAAPAEMIEADPFGLPTIAAANPGMGYTVTQDYLTGKALEASASPAQLNRYLRLHLGKRTKQASQWLDVAKWDAAMGATPTVEEWQKRTAFGGLDLSSTTDFTAAAIIAPLEDGGYLGAMQFWIPEDRVDALERSLMVPLREWNAAGFLTFTEGNVVDYGKVRADFAAEIKRLGVTMSEVAYDPWNAAETVQQMQTDGFTMVPLRQGYGSLSSPAKEVERLVMGSTPKAPLLRFGWNPVLRWMAANAEVMQDPAGNIKPAKPDRRRSSVRIDGIAALVNAVARAMLRTPPKKKRRGGFG